MAMPAAATTHDQTFGTGGIVRIPLAGVGSPTAAEAIAVQNDGKLVVAGRAQGTSGSDYAVTRLNPDGSLDTTFGPAHTGTATAPFGGTFNEAFGVAVDAGGNIVAVGQTNVSSTSGPDIAIARWDAQGNPDTSFNASGTPGREFIPVGSGTHADYADGVAFQPGGKIVIGGGAGSSGNDEFALVRLESNGALDDGTVSDPDPPDSFGPGGIVTLDLGSGETFTEAMLQQPDGKILLTGETDVDPTPGANFDFAVARFNSDGSLDSGTVGDSTPADHFGTA